MNPTDRRSAIARWLVTWWSRVVAGAALAAVAGVTGRISYFHIYELTLSLGQPVMVARLMPFGVDGLIVVGSVVLLQSVPGQWWLGWLGVGPGIAASVFANVESGLGRGPLAAAWAGVPAAFFALATFILERWLKSQVSRGKPVAAMTTEEAVRALLASTSQRRLADVLGVPRTRVQAWAGQVAEGGREMAEDAA